jgi:hypothetical protein
MGSKLCPCQDKVLAMGGMMSLLNSTLSNVHLYIISLYRMLMGPRERMDTIINNFMWDKDADKNYMFVKGSKWFEDFLFGNNEYFSIR